MGLFSKDPELDNRLMGAITQAWFSADMSRGYQQAEGLKKAAVAQEAIFAATANDPIRIIVPCFSNNLGFDGILVLTEDRMLKFRKTNVDNEIPYALLAGYHRWPTKHGHFLLQFESREAAEFRAFSQDIASPGGKKYWNGVIQAPVLTSAQADDIEQVIAKTGKVVDHGLS